MKQKTILLLFEIADRLILVAIAILILWIAFNIMSLCETIGFQMIDVYSSWGVAIEPSNR